MPRLPFDLRPFLPSTRLLWACQLIGEFPRFKPMLGGPAKWRFRIPLHRLVMESSEGPDKS